MIKNDNQYHASLNQLSKISEALQQHIYSVPESEGVSFWVWDAYREALKSQYDELLVEVSQYETTKFNNTMQREFSTEAVMTLLCEINFCQNFNDVKELMGWLLNVDQITTIDTMANAPICGATLASQFPKIAQSLESVNEDNWMAYHDRIIAEHGAYLTVSKTIPQA